MSRELVSKGLIPRSDDAESNTRVVLDEARAFLAGRVEMVDDEVAELVRRLTRLRFMPLAVRVADRQLRLGSSAPSILHRKGLALARMGGLALARDLAERVLQDPSADVRWRAECFGLRGRVFKDLAAVSDDVGQASSFMTLARQSYLDGFREASTADPSHVEAAYLGVNAATLSLILERPRFEVNSLAIAARDRCDAEMRARGQELPGAWQAATLAECALLLEERSTSESLYRSAYSAMSGEWDSVASMRANARRIVAHLDRGNEEWANVRIRVPKVGMFAGHMIDRPNRRTARFPASAASEVTEAIVAAIAEADVGFAHASAASGGDLIFHESVRARLLAPEFHGCNRVVLPFAPDAFRRTSVEYGALGDWGARFDHLLGSPDIVVRMATRERDADDDAYFGYAQHLVTGYATMEARSFGDIPVALCAWDGKTGDGSYGTAGAIAEWRRQGFEVHNVLQHTRYFAGAAPSEPLAPAHSSFSSAEYEHHSAVAAMVSVFANLESAATDGDHSRAIERILDASVAPRDRLTVEAPIVRTHATGVDFVLRSSRAACRLGFDIVSTLSAAQDSGGDGVDAGATLGARVYLHSSLLFSSTDPATGAVGRIGGRSPATERVLPTLDGGTLYATEAFAAAAAADGVPGLRWEPLVTAPDDRPLEDETVYCIADPLSEPIDWSRRVGTEEEEERLRNVRVRASNSRESTWPYDNPSVLVVASMHQYVPVQLRRPLQLLTAAFVAEEITLWFLSSDRDRLQPMGFVPVGATTLFPVAVRASHGLLGLSWTNGGTVRWGGASTDATHLPSSRVPLAAFAATVFRCGGAPCGVVSVARASKRVSDGVVAEPFTDDLVASLEDLAELLEHLLDSAVNRARRT